MKYKSLLLMGLMAFCLTAPAGPASTCSEEQTAATIIEQTAPSMTFDILAPVTLYAYDEMTLAIQSIIFLQDEESQEISIRGNAKPQAFSFWKHRNFDQPPERYRC